MSTILCPGPVGKHTESVQLVIVAGEVRREVGVRLYRAPHQVRFVSL